MSVFSEQDGLTQPAGTQEQPLNHRRAHDQHRRAQSAVVIGSGFTGLMLARVLSDYFENVTVIERGELPVRVDYRKGVPQAYHHHVLLKRGQGVIERLFPGFDKALAQLDAPQIDYGRDVQLIANDGALPRFESGLALRPCRRIAIDYVLYQMLKERSNVTFLDETKATGLVFCRDANNVSGVRISGEYEAYQLDTDLVIDCSGRGSKLPSWLKELNGTETKESRVDAGISYASQLFRLPSSQEGQDLETESQHRSFQKDLSRYCMDVAAAPPSQPRAIGLWPVEGGLWQLTCIAMNGLAAPDDASSLKDFIAHVGVPALDEFLERAKPESSIKRHKGTAGVWKHYHKVNMPSGLLVMGDSNCCYNPLHGQGMSVVASAVSVLEDKLARGVEQSFSSEWVREVLGRTRWVYLQAWSIALTEDLRWNKAKHKGLFGVPVLRWAHHYIDFLIRRGARRPKIVQRCLDVTNMVRSPLVLAGPTMIKELVLSIGQKPELSLAQSEGAPVSQSSASALVARKSGDTYIATGDDPLVQRFISLWGQQSSSYFGYQKSCQFFIHKTLGCIAFAQRRVFGKTINVTPTSPYCSPQNIAALAREFEASTNNPALYLGVDAETCRALESDGYTFSQLGREFQTPLKDFKVEGKQMKYLRWAANLAKRGFEVREQPWPEVDQKRVLEISETWRKQKRFSYRELAMLTRPPVFSDEWQVRKFYCYLEGKLVGYVFFDPYFRAGKVVGYCANILRSDPKVRPHGFLDLVILEATKLFREEGLESVSLGMAPLYNVQAEDGDISSVRKTARFIYNHGSFFYAFQALAYHKQRYRMQETPWYICYRGLSLPQVSFATARACRVI